jgi:hypothetical protein
VLAWMALTHLQSRFLLPAVLPVALITGLSVERPATWRVVATMAVVLQALFVPFVFLQDLKGAGGGDIGVALAPAGMLARAPQAIIWPDVRATEGRPGIMLVGAATAFYFRWPVVYNTVWDKGELAEWLRTDSGGRVVERLKEAKIKYLVVDWGEMERLRKDYGFEPGVTVEAMDSLVKAGLTKASAGRAGLEAYVVPE